MRKLVTILAGVLLAGCNTDSAGPVLPSDGPSTLPNATLAFVSNRSGTPKIYLANSDGSGVTLLTSGEAPAWSWDGARLAFHRGASGGGDAGIYTIDVDGRNERLVGSGWYPAWSPDGRMAYANIPDGLYVTNADGTGKTLLVPHDFADTDPDYYYDSSVQRPTWSPDGQRIAFVRVAGGYETPVWETFIVNVDGSNVRLLSPLSPDTWTIPTTMEPAWSPDGLRIAVVAVERGSQVGQPAFSHVIADYDVNGSGSRRVHARPIAWWPRGYIGNPDWSPDGREIVFDQHNAPTVPGSAFNPRMRVFIVTLETGVVRQLIPEAVDPVLPQYSDYDASWLRSSR